VKAVLNSPLPYLTFVLGNELFALEVAHVQEIVELPEVTRVPDAPTYMRGVVNVRGKAVPIIDLRLKFGLPPTADTHDTRVVVMELTLDGETVILGGIADSVREVIEIDAAQIAPPPRLAMRWRSELIKGMSRRGEQFIILLNLSAVFSSDELALVNGRNLPFS